MSADIPRMPIYRRHFASDQLQFITTSTYRRSRLFTCQRFLPPLCEILNLHAWSRYLAKKMHGNARPAPAGR